MKLISDKELEIVGRYARDLVTLVEIGTFEGESATAIRKRMSPDGTLHLVEHFLGDPVDASVIPNRRETLSNVMAVKNGTIAWHPFHAHDVARYWTKKIDFLFIDGDHREEAARLDWLFWSPFVTGVVLFHDVGHFPGVTKVYDELFKDGGAKEWQEVDRMESIRVVQKKDPLSSS